MTDQFFAIKTRNPISVKQILAKDSDIELDGINVMQEAMLKGTILFIVLGGDRPSWDTGLIGIGVVSKEPYDIGYDKKNYKIKIDMKVVLDSPIKRESLIPYKDCYGIIAIGPQLKGEPNQALTTMTRKQGVALMRAMADLYPNIVDDIKNLADASLQKEIFGSAVKMIEVPFDYEEDEASAINRYILSHESEENILEKRRKAFTEWMRKYPKSNGDFYTDPIVKDYSSLLATCPQKLEGITLENPNLYFYDDPDKFYEIIQIIKSASNFDEINSKTSNGRLSAAMSKYHEYLTDIHRNKKENESNESNEPDDIQKEIKNCLTIRRSPRTTIIHPLNFIIYGAPGTGKTYSTAEYALAIIENRLVDTSKKTVEERKAVMKRYTDYIKKGQIIFTTFHQSYGYEEFIQGLRPDTSSEHMAFKTVDGIFKHISDMALNDNENNYVMIIDEINRANISKVFGELITLIEEDKRWGEVNETCATLQSGDVFAVPNNLYIVGTMNSADKSISLIDAALRRRFEFIEQHPDISLITDPILRKVLKKLNEVLAESLESSDLLIGHSFFMGKNEENLCTILNNSIIPLLYEYFYDNKKKVISVLNESLQGLNIDIKDEKISRVYVVKAEKAV